MPGIIVTTAVRTGPTNPQTAATATMFVAGITTRGPDGTSHLITSLSDFQDIYCLTFHEKARDLLTLYLTPWSVLFSRVPAKSFQMTHNVPR